MKIPFLPKIKNIDLFYKKTFHPGFILLVHQVCLIKIFTINYCGNMLLHESKHNKIQNTQILKYTQNGVLNKIIPNADLLF